MERILKECKKHGLAEHRKRKRGELVCVECNRQRVYQWRRDAKAKLVSAHGGCCGICGYGKCNRALEFHHIDPETKKFAISSFSSCMNWTRLLEESQKCYLLCANCHAEVEEGVTALPDRTTLVLTEEIAG